MIWKSDKIPLPVIGDWEIAIFVAVNVFLLHPLFCKLFDQLMSHLVFK